jgi:hypothetical protein
MALFLSFTTVRSRVQQQITSGAITRMTVKCSGVMSFPKAQPAFGYWRGLRHRRSAPSVWWVSFEAYSRAQPKLQFSATWAIFRLKVVSMPSRVALPLGKSRHTLSLPSTTRWQSVPLKRCARHGVLRAAKSSSPASTVWPQLVGRAFKSPQWCNRLSSWQRRPSRLSSVTCKAVRISLSDRHLGRDWPVICFSSLLKKGHHRLWFRSQLSWR